MLNVVMVVIGGIVGWIVYFIGLLVDVLDMLFDVIVYVIGLVVIGCMVCFKVNVVWVSGSVLFVLGVGVLVEVGCWVMYGVELVSGWMIGIVLLLLVVNMVVLCMLVLLKFGEVYL